MTGIWGNWDDPPLPSPAAAQRRGTSVVLPDLLQPLLGPEHQGIEALLALEGHLATIGPLDHGLPRGFYRVVPHS